jgi:hypothetical protein
MAIAIETAKLPMLNEDCLRCRHCSRVVLARARRSACAFQCLEPGDHRPYGPGSPCSAGTDGTNYLFADVFHIHPFQGGQAEDFAVRSCNCGI